MTFQMSFKGILFKPVANHIANEVEGLV